MARRAVLATTSEVELQQSVEDLMLQMDPRSLGGMRSPLRGGKRHGQNNEYDEVIRQLRRMAGRLPTTLTADDIAEDM